VPVDTLTDIAILWKRATIRCVLAGDGVVWVLVLRDGQQTLKRTMIHDEATALITARAWLQEHEGGNVAMRGPKRC
jgi:hypothetical protein